MNPIFSFFPTFSTDIVENSMENFSQDSLNNNNMFEQTLFSPPPGLFSDEKEMGGECLLSEEVLCAKKSFQDEESLLPQDASALFPFLVSVLPGQEQPLVAPSPSSFPSWEPMRLAPGQQNQSSLPWGQEKISISYFPPAQPMENPQDVHIPLLSKTSFDTDVSLLEGSDPIPHKLNVLDLAHLRQGNYLSKKEYQDSLLPFSSAQVQISYSSVSPRALSESPMSLENNPFFQESSKAQMPELRSFLQESAVMARQGNEPSVFAPLASVNGMEHFKMAEHAVQANSSSFEKESSEKKEVNEDIGIGSSTEHLSFLESSLAEHPFSFTELKHEKGAAKLEGMSSSLPESAVSQKTDSIFEKTLGIADQMHIRRGGMAKVQIEDAAFGKVDIHFKMSDKNVLNIEMTTSQNDLKSKLEEKIDSLKGALGEHKIHLQDMKIHYVESEKGIASHESTLTHFDAPSFAPVDKSSSSSSSFQQQQSSSQQQQRFDAYSQNGGFSHSQNQGQHQGQQGDFLNHEESFSSRPTISTKISEKINARQKGSIRNITRSANGSIKVTA